MISRFLAVVLILLFPLKAAALTVDFPIRMHSSASIVSIGTNVRLGWNGYYYETRTPPPAVGDKILVSFGFKVHFERTPGKWSIGQLAFAGSMDALPLDPTVPAYLDRQFSLSGTATDGRGSVFQVFPNGTITCSGPCELYDTGIVISGGQYTVAAVPAPAAGIALASGIGALAAFGRRRRRRQI